MTNVSSNEKEKSNFTHVLLIDLDYVAVNLRKVEFEAIQRGLEPKGISLNKSIFTKSSMSPNHRSTITEILKSFGKKADAIEKAVTEVKKSVASYFDEKNSLNDGVKELIKSAKDRNVEVKFYSTTGKSLVDRLLINLGLNEDEIEVIIPSEINNIFPKADDWLKMLKQANIEDKTIVAVVSSQLACKGALTAGASCVVVPDEFTEFQDFSGSMFILDKLDNINPDEVLDHTLRM